MSAHQQPGSQKPATSPVSPLTQVLATPEHLKYAEEESDAYGAPKKPPMNSVYSPFDEKNLQFEAATTTNGRIQPTASKTLTNPHGSKEGFSFGAAGRPATVKTPSTRTSSLPSTQPSHLQAQRASKSPFPPGKASMLPSRIAAIQSLDTPSDPPPNPTVSPATDPSFSSDAQTKPALPSTPSRNTIATSTVGSSLAASGEKSSGQKRTVTLVGPQWEVSATPPRPLPILNYPKHAPEDYNPYAEFVPPGASRSTESAVDTSIYENLVGVNSSSADNVVNTTNKPQRATVPSFGVNATNTTSTLGSTEGDNKNEDKNKPTALPKTWDSKWFGNPLPGPKPEWSYTMPKNEPKMSRVYRNPDGSDKLVFVDQDDAPYTAMGTRWAEDKQAHARFIMQRIKENEMTREQAEAEYKQYFRSQKFLQDRNTPRFPVRSQRCSIIPDTVEAGLEKTGVDKATVKWLFESFSTMTGTFGYYTSETYKQTRTLLDNLLEIVQLLWTICIGALPWIFRELRSVLWWLLAAIIVFLVVFGVMNDWMGAMGLHKYHIPSTHTSTTLHSNMPTDTATISVTSGDPTIRPAVISISGISTPFTTENFATGQVGALMQYPETLTAQLIKQLRSTSPDKSIVLTMGKSMLSVPQAAASSIQTIWSSSAVANLSSSMPDIHPHVPSWMDPSPVGQLISSVFSQLIDWTYALITFVNNTRIVSFITDLRVIMAVICVIATLGLFYVSLGLLRTTSNLVLTKAMLISNSTLDLTRSLAQTVSAPAAEHAWPIITIKYTKARTYLREASRTVKSAVLNIPVQITVFIFSIPYILIWALGNPMASLKSLIGYSFAYIGGLILTTITFLVTCICWPFTFLVTFLNCILETTVSFSQTSWTWLERQFVSFKTEMSAWAGAPGGWPTLWSVMSWFRHFVKWSLVLVIWTVMVFALGLGWRDIYEGFEKVIIEVAPC